MTIAIHNRPGSFSDEWIKYCKNNKIDFKLVNCFDSNITNQLKDCSGLLWNWSQSDSRAMLFAKQLTYSLEHEGIKVFPNFKTCWHYDDKVGQKYLLEVINAPLINTFIFYDKHQAKKWANNATYPKIFKLRGGAGSVNVKLVKSRNQAFMLINKAFGKGFYVPNRINSLKDRFLLVHKEKNFHSFIHLLKGFIRLIKPSYDEKMRSREKGYIYFQDFIPNNTHDIRVVIIGNRACAIKRIVRNQDFRASGSGNLIYKKEEIGIDYIESAFVLAEKLNTQCIAFDFLVSQGKILLTEISYAFVPSAYWKCQGYWDRNLNWHEGKIVPEWFMIEDFLNTI